LLGTELVGQIALARPQRDYSEHDLEAVRRLAVFYALAIQRVRAEETILQSLAEKEALLREIHHRVKNNLQTVSSLLSMAQMGAKNTEASDLLRDAESRVHAMALIHSQLYGTRQLDRIDVKRNIRELTDRLSSIYSAPMHHIVQSVEGDDVFLSIHQAIPVALAINEVVINAYKYAFAGRSAGTIHVSVVHGKDTASITIADNGIGLPPDFDVEKTETLGLRLVKNLIEGQLGGRVDFASRKGAKITMSFKTDGRERIHAEKDYR
jgi:two-component sensor histidine kinase